MWRKILNICLYVSIVICIFGQRIGMFFMNIATVVREFRWTDGSMLVQTLNRRKYLVLESDPAGSIVKTLQRKKFSYIVLPEKLIHTGEFEYKLVSIPAMEYDTPELKEEFERRFQYNQIMEVLKEIGTNVKEE